MTMAFVVKDGVPSMRFETHDSASMLFRHVDVDLAAYPMLAWRWYIELPIRSPLDERTREGDDHSCPGDGTANQQPLELPRGCPR
jgi:Protein of unknown function (DUF3047)